MTSAHESAGGSAATTLLDNLLACPTQAEADLFAEYQATDSARANVPQARPVVSGQCAQVLELIRQHQSILSFVLTANHAIPEAAARVHDLRAMGFNVMTTIVPRVAFRGVPRRNVALYSIGSPEWIAATPSQAGRIDLTLAGLIAFGAVCLALLAGVVG